MIQCDYCEKTFNDDDIDNIFNQNLCNKCLEHILKYDVQHLRDSLHRVKQVNKDDIDLILYRLDKINDKG